MNKKKFLTVFFISTIIFSLLYFAIGYKIVSLEKLREDTNKFYVQDHDILDKDKEEIEQVLEHELLFLLAGIDNNNLSDTLILCKVNFDNGNIDLISIPRDSRVLVDGNFDKINHSHAKGGIDLTIKTIEDFLHIDLDYYARVDLDAVEAIVDAIDGVEIDVKQDMFYTDTTKGEELFINLKKGKQILNGNEAIQFLRFRRYPNGDAGRVEAQQQFLTALIEQTLQAKNITKWSKFLETYYSYVDTNIPIGLITDGMKMILSWNSEKINTYTIPGEGMYIGNTSYYVIDESEKKDLIFNVLNEYIILD